MSLLKLAAVLAWVAKLGAAQLPPTPPILTHSTTWNSSFKFTDEQFELANLTDSEATDLEQILNFDRTLLANGGPAYDDFYRVPSFKGKHVPKHSGQVLKIQDYTDPANWSIPAQLAMSRIMYTTTDLNGTLVPASGYILWPHQAKTLKKCNDKRTKQAPTVLWTHGTSGYYADGAPSAHRELFYGHYVPFALAQAGYAVIAPDYAGLGVNKSWDGSYVPHQYLIREAGAKDALNAYRASLSAFPKRLTEDYVVMGHSQGGGVAWGLSELLARKHSGFEDVSKNHLGTVVAAPPTNQVEISEVFLPWIGKDLSKIFPDFKLEYWFTKSGLDRLKILNQVQGSQMLSTYLFKSLKYYQPDWRTNFSIDRIAKLIAPSRLPFKGPMLLVQGEEDPGVPAEITLESFRATCKKYPGDLQYLSVPGAGHFPGLNAAKQNWLQWIEDRHEGRRLQRKGCYESEIESFLPTERYQKDGLSFALWAGKREWTYELPQGH